MDDAEEEIHEIEIAGALKRSTAEVLTLEIQRLAKRHGIRIKSSRVEAASDDD